MKKILLLLGLCVLTGCDGYDSGYSDGYAAGYNTTCNIRSTLVSDSINPLYKNGYKIKT